MGRELDDVWPARSDYERSLAEGLFDIGPSALYRSHDDLVILTRC
jgi:hypothetical protein